MKYIIYYIITYLTFLNADTVGIEKTWHHIPESVSIQEYRQTEQTLYTPTQESKEWVTTINPNDRINTNNNVMSQKDIEALPMATIVPIEPTQEMIPTSTPTIQSKQSETDTLQNAKTLILNDNYMGKIESFILPIKAFYHNNSAQFFTLIAGVFLLFFLLLYLPLKRRIRREEDEEMPIFVNTIPTSPTKYSFI